MKKYTFSKHIKFRREKESILICDCKTLRDFEVDLDLEEFVKRVSCGIVKKKITKDIEKLLFEDFISMKMLSEIRLKPILENEFKLADEFMERHLYKGKRVRSYEFLLNKLKEFPSFFIALYLDNELAGVVQGFPREDYLLVSEIAVDIRFRRRKFGSLLLQKFEKNALKSGHRIIKLGAEENSTNFYLSNHYYPSLFIQVPIEKEEAIIKKLKKNKENIMNVSHVNNLSGIELPVKNCSKDLLSETIRKFKPISAQFLFTKKIDKNKLAHQRNVFSKNP